MIDFTNGSGTILLTGGELDVDEFNGSGLITINGTNQNITINGQGNSTVLGVNGQSTQVAIDSLTITGGANTQGGGGGIDNIGSLTVTNSTISGNSAVGGGGIANDEYGTLTLTNCTISGNSATADQGGGLSNDGMLTVTNSTISGNAAPGQYYGDGGGIYNNATLDATLTVNNSIIAGNTAESSPDIYGAVASGSTYNLIGDGTGMTGISNAASGNQVGSSSNPINPLLAPLGSYGGPTQTMALLPGSPAIDAGSNSLAVDANGNSLTTDQRGESRIFNGTVDIGAFESQGFTWRRGERR